jgi:TRAP transporter 4TM/12TM fusion protein
MSIPMPGILGPTTAVSSTYIILFIIFAAFLQASKVGDYFVNFAFAAAGRARGGPAKVAIFASGLMGMINGTSAGNVVATGSLTIPLMKKVGYHKKTAGAIEAAASTGGQIMPPIMGAGAFIMAEITGIPYQEIAIAAIIPAILYFASIYFMVDFEAAKLGMRGMREDELPKFKRDGAQGLPVPADHHPDRGAVHGLFGDPGGHAGHGGRGGRQLGDAGTLRLRRRQMVDPADARWW